MLKKVQNVSLYLRWLLLVFVICFVLCMGRTVYAQEYSESYEILQTETVVQENPVMAKALLPAELEEQIELVEAYAEGSAVLLNSEEVTWLTSEDEAVVMLRDAMKNRQDEITITIKLTDPGLSESSYRQTLLSNIFHKAIAHTGISDEGDYLAWNYERWSAAVGGKYYKASGTYELSLNYIINYYTSFEQEKQVAQDIASIEHSLAWNGKNDIEKIRLIYDYICKNVAYDYAHRNDNTYTLKHTAYAAVENHTAVCQGFALMFYRMALDSGVDARIVSGYSTQGENHGWNIVQIDDRYYYLDATWDSEFTNHRYFLKGSDSFLTNHILAEEGDELAKSSSMLVAQYPVSTTDYSDSGKAEETGTSDESESGGESGEDNDIENSSDQNPLYETGIYSVDGKQIYYTDGERSHITDIIEISGDWYNLVDGVVTPNMIAQNEDGWWCIDSSGTIDFTYTGMYKAAGKGWIYIKNGKWDTGYIGMAKNDYGWWYIRNGELDQTYSGMAKNAYGWWYMRNGKLDTTYTGLSSNAYGIWYMKNGKLDTSKSGMYKDAAEGWIYLNKGKWDTSFQDVAKNAYGQWYMQNGKLDTSLTGMYKAKTYGWIYVNKGKWDTGYTGMAKNAYGWWYMKDGKLDQTYTGMAKNAYGWWYMKNGKLDQTFTGIAQNQYGSWYMVKGKLAGNYSGKITYASQQYTVKNGKATKI